MDVVSGRDVLGHDTLSYDQGATAEYAACCTRRASGLVRGPGCQQHVHHRSTRLLKSRAGAWAGCPWI